MSIILEAKNLKKSYQMGEIEVRALRGANFTVEEGSFVVILGPSGSGKSTLLNILGGMDVPDSGEVIVSGQTVTSLSDKELTQYRRTKVGFVFQFYNIMASLTARENVELATEIAKDPLDIDEIMGAVGLAERAEHFPSQMSGGEQQRVSIARAIAKNPDLLLCDEPTGALDYQTGVSILALLAKINKEMGKTVIVITHNTGIADMADRVLRMRSGEIVEDRSNPTPLSPEEITW
ncbi:MAG: ABC transporter ATP-binding protein [Clostridiales bacterium]|mgnify:CR=1 FL=1|nr:ABC transporter ATP-binding protein [Clostridiales bacterium]